MPVGLRRRDSVELIGAGTPAFRSALVTAHLAGISDLTFPFAQNLTPEAFLCQATVPTAPLDGIEARFGRSAGSSGLFLPAKQPRC